MKLQFTHEDGATQTVIVPNHRTVQTGTLGSIIRQSGLDVHRLKRNPGNKRRNFALVLSLKTA